MFLCLFLFCSNARGRRVEHGKSVQSCRTYGVSEPYSATKILKPTPIYAGLLFAWREEEPIGVYPLLSPLLQSGLLVSEEGKMCIVDVTKGSVTAEVRIYPGSHLSYHDNNLAVCGGGSTIIKVYECTLLTVYKVVQFGQCLQHIHLFGQTLLGADTFALVYLSSLSANIQVVGPTIITNYLYLPRDDKYCKGGLEYENPKQQILYKLGRQLSHTDCTSRNLAASRSRTGPSARCEEEGLI
eukprot:sb/3469060/